MGIFDFLFKKRNKDDEPALGVTSDMCAKPKAKKCTAQKKQQPAEAPEAAPAVSEEVVASADVAADAVEPVEIDESTFEVVDEQSFDESEPAGGGRKRVGTFNVKRAKDGRYVFNLYNANKVIIATSQIYSSAQSAMNGVKSVMTNATRAQVEDTTLKNPKPKTFPKWEVYLDRAGQYRFRLYAPNGSCICHAKAGYSSSSSCKRGIDSIVRLAEAAQIDKAYLMK